MIIYGYFLPLISFCIRISDVCQKASFRANWSSIISLIPLTNRQNKVEGDCTHASKERLWIFIDAMNNVPHGPTETYGCSLLESHKIWIIEITFTQNVKPLVDFSFQSRKKVAEINAVLPRCLVKTSLDAWWKQV